MYYSLIKVAPVTVKIISFL